MPAPVTYVYTQPTEEAVDHKWLNQFKGDWIFSQFPVDKNAFSPFSCRVSPLMQVTDALEESRSSFFISYICYITY